MSPSAPAQAPAPEDRYDRYRCFLDSGVAASRTATHWIPFPTVWVITGPLDGRTDGGDR
ncbi:hypothetical protein [Streptomyces sp. NPDC093600]|uniref:hypothetical protein n=1 Tax=Streptomyces sp. NPDC093600 TaxID=3366047 RepID=UPI00381C8205